MYVVSHLLPLHSMCTIGFTLYFVVNSCDNSAPNTIENNTNKIVAYIKNPTLWRSSSSIYIIISVTSTIPKSRSSPTRAILTTARVGPYYYITHIYIPPAYVPQTPLPLMNPRPRTYQTPIFKIVKFEAPTLSHNCDCGII
jgi:hypothetical protein